MSEDNKILSIGYNGFPKGCSDDEFPWRREGDPYDTKYFYTTHSELNAILNYRGGSLEGAKLYVSLFPCNECAKAIIQCGIRTVVYDCDKYDGTPSVRASKRMMNAAGVRYYKYQKTGRNIGISVYCDKNAAGQSHREERVLWHFSGGNYVSGKCIKCN